MWYNTNRDYTLYVQKLQNSKIDEYEKQSILTMSCQYLAEGISKFRMMKYISVLRIMLERGAIPYHRMTKDDLYAIIEKVRHEWELGLEAQRDYLIGLRRILRYHGMVELATLIKIKKPNKLIKALPESILDIFDIKRLVQAAQNPRDAAIAACLYESDSRPKEFFSLRWNDVHFQKIPVRVQNGSTHDEILDVAFLNIEGKTGCRRPFIYFSVPYLLAWKRAYPKGADGSVWIDLERELEQINYYAANKILRTLGKRAGIDKQVTAYKFRHGRNTEVCEVLSYAQHCEYAGWYQGSEMPRIYNHLAGASMLQPILSEFGVVVDRREAIRKAWKDLYEEEMKKLREGNLKKAVK